MNLYCTTTTRPYVLANSTNPHACSKRSTFVHARANNKLTIDVVQYMYVCTQHVLQPVMYMQLQALPKLAMPTVMP